MRTVDTFTPKITFIGIIESQTDHIYHKTAEDIADDSVDNFIINAGHQTDLSVWVQQTRNLDWSDYISTCYNSLLWVEYSPHEDDRVEVNSKMRKIKEIPCPSPALTPHIHLRDCADCSL